MALFLDSTGQLVVAASMPVGGSVVASAATSNLVDTAPWFRSLDDGTAQWHPANYYASGGESALVIDGRLTLGAVTIPAANDGTTIAGNFSLATGTFNVFLGTLDVTSACSFAVDSSTNLTASINASTGIYAATAMPTANDSGAVTFSATYKGQTIKLTFIVTKSKNGANGAGVNVCNPRYCTFEESVLPPVLTYNATATLESNNGFFGKKSLKLQANAGDSQVHLRDTNTSFNVFLQPNKKWILSFYVTSGANPISIGQVEGYVILQNGGFANIINTSSIAPNVWTRVSGVIDLTSHDSTTCFIRLDNNTAGTTIWYDGIMLEAQSGDNTQPSPYHEPPNFLTTFIGDLNATNGATWGSNVTGQPTSLSTLNAADGSKLSSIEAGADVTLNKIGGSGINVIPPRYCTFKETVLPPMVAPTATVSPDTTIKKFGKQSLKVLANANDSYVILSKNGEFNITIQPNKKWIVSFYVFCQSIIPATTSNTGIEIYVQASNGNYYNISFGVPILANSWVRVSGVIDLTSNISTSCSLRLDNNQSGLTVWFDGIMMEAQIGNGVYPSPFHEPNNFLTNPIYSPNDTGNPIFQLSESGLAAFPKNGYVQRYSGSYNFPIIQDGKIDLAGTNTSNTLLTNVPIYYSSQGTYRMFVQVVGYYDDTALSKSSANSAYLAGQVYWDNASGSLAYMATTNISTDTTDSTNFPASKIQLVFDSATQQLKLKLTARTGQLSTGHTYYRYLVWAMNEGNYSPSGFIIY
jgi:hypothetical protein